MKCAVCNSSEFLFHDGVYSCKECNTHAEESRKEESEQVGFSKRTLQKSSATGKESKVSGERNLYASWTTTEAFNLILYKQVSALIRLGASEKLRDVIFCIWSRYLQKCEFAFRKDYKAAEEERVPRLSAFPKRRDIKVLYGDKDATKRRKYVKKKILIKKLSSSKVKVENEETNISTEVDSDVSENITSESDNNNSSSSEDSPVQKEYIKLSSHAQKLIRTDGIKKVKKRTSTKYTETCVHHMTLSKTLCFCYLGLLITEDQLLLCDLLRLVREGKIPYMNAADCLPPSMKLQCADHALFNTLTTPDLKKISLMSAKLIEFLKLPSFKHRPLMPIVFRYVRDLNLTDSIIPVVKFLNDERKMQGLVWYDTIRYGKRVLHIPLYEVQAMALIVIALKLLFVLDGEFEKEHSEIMMKINTLLEGQKLFVWNEWKRQISLKEFLFMKSGSSYSDYSRMDSLSAEEIIRKYPLPELKDDSNKKERKRTFFITARKGIKTILENVTNLKDDAFHQFSSFPLKFELDRLMTEWKTRRMYKETEAINFEFLSKDFSSHLLFYNHNEEIAAESEELIYILLSSLYESTDVVNWRSMTSYYQRILGTSSRYWFKNIHTNELRESTQVWCEKLPISFVWLLKVLCKYMQIPCNELYSEILLMEKELFPLFKKVRPPGNVL